MKKIILLFFLIKNILAFELIDIEGSKISIGCEFINREIEISEVLSNDLVYSFPQKDGSNHYVTSLNERKEILF